MKHIYSELIEWTLPYVFIYYDLPCVSPFTLLNFAIIDLLVVVSLSLKGVDAQLEKETYILVAKERFCKLSTIFCRSFTLFSFLSFEGDLRAYPTISNPFRFKFLIDSWHRGKNWQIVDFMSSTKKLVNKLL